MTSDFLMLASRIKFYMLNLFMLASRIKFHLLDLFIHEEKWFHLLDLIRLFHASSKVKNILVRSFQACKQSKVLLAISLQVE